MTNVFVWVLRRGSAVGKFKEEDLDGFDESFFVPRINQLLQRLHLSFESDPIYLTLQCKSRHFITHLPGSITYHAINA